MVFYAVILYVVVKHCSENYNKLVVVCMNGLCYGKYQSQWIIVLLDFGNTVQLLYIIFNHMT